MFATTHRRQSAQRSMAEVRQLLAAADPAPAAFDDGEQARLATIRDQVLAATAGPRVGRVWWPGRLRRHRRVVVTCVAAPALLAASAAGWVALTSSPAASRVTVAVVCYSKPHLPERGSAEDSSGGAATGASPVAMCAKVWDSGLFGSGHRPARLAACAVLSLGIIGVFPDTTCRALGLRPVPAGYRRAARQFFRFVNALVTGLTGAKGRSRCATEPAAVAFTRRAMRRYGFADWRIIVPSQVPAHLCWQAQPDPVRHAVEIVEQIGTYPRSNVPAHVIDQVMAPLWSNARCRTGKPVERTSAVSRALRVALRNAGYPGWRVQVLGTPTSSSQPCYVSGGFSAATRTVFLNSVGG